MLSAARIKHIASLRVPKYRELHRQTLAEGTRVITELLLSGSPQQELIATEKWADEYHTLWLDAGARVTLCSDKELERMSALKSPQGVLAVIEIPSGQKPLNTKTFTLYCDRINDPGNLGTILRIADWFGADQVITSPGSVNVYNPKVIQASMGSIFRVHHAVAPLAELKQAQQVQILGAVMNGISLNSVQITKPLVLVIGNEAEGISRDHLTLCNELVTIPGGSTHRTPGASAESLNAAIASAILCYHVTQTA
jgi:TrmH family RNA methyltransferase